MMKKANQYLFASMFLCLACIVPAIVEASDDYWAPWVTKTTTNSATINWRGKNNKAGSIDYATLSYYNDHQSFDKTAVSHTTTNYQHVLLADLDPDTEYIYKVKPSENEDVFSNRTFRTMPVSGPFTFIVISDSQEGDNYTEEKRFKYVGEAIAKETNVLFILHGGDYAGHDSEDLWTTYFQLADGMLSKFAIFPVIGNHEYHNGGATNGPTAADQYHWAYGIDMDTPLNYSFDCSGIRFVILNSPDPNNANGDDPHTSLALAQSQAPWLSNQLDNTMSGTFTIHHHPIWDNGRTNIDSNLEPWESLYHAYKISANFAGHTHNYQRFLVEGIPYFIVGIGGGQCADITNTVPTWYQFGETRKLGYIKVFVDPANNTATLQEIVAATVEEDDDDETPYVYDTPVIDDTVTFPLKTVIGPVIKANGSINDITINNGANLSITVQMNPGEFDGYDVDWWIVARAGSSLYYLNNSVQWTQFDGNLSNCHPVNQGALFNLPATEVLNMSGLPVGSYTFWFAVDYPMDGILNLDGQILVDSVKVVVQ